MTDSPNFVPRMVNQAESKSANRSCRQSIFGALTKMEWLNYLEMIMEPMSRLAAISLRLPCRNKHSKYKRGVPSIPFKKTIGIDAQPADSEFAFRAADDDPQCVSGSHFLRLLKGWKELELCVRSATASGQAKLYIDYGDGWSEEDAISMSFVSGRSYKRIVYFPSRVRRLRFDPVESPGEFTLEKFVLYPCWKIFARKAMHRRLLTGDRSGQKKISRNKGARESTRAMPGQWSCYSLDVLYELYNQTFRKELGAEVNYLYWVKRIELITTISKAEATRKSSQFPNKPVFSVLVPVYNTPEEFLRACLDSVVTQSYPYWQLCIADDASTESHVHDVLEEYAVLDPRIRVTYRQQNGHISVASNSALELADGNFVALLDHDDVLAEHALLYMAEAINKNPDAKILYSDEDKIDATGDRFAPHFKSDWNPDLILAQNYLSHLGVYSRELITGINGFREGLEGSQDHDLLLRCLPHIRDDQIIHIPRILYHWRAMGDSVAIQPSNKSYTTDAGLKALRDYFSELGNNAVTVEAGLVPNTYRVRWPIPAAEPLVSLLIPTRDKRVLLEACVRSILDKTEYRNYEILILDNGSSEAETFEFFRTIQEEDSRVRVLRYGHPFNYSAINNFGEQRANGELIGLVNNDVEVISPDWLTEMVSQAIRPEIGCVGAKLYYEDDTIQHAGVILGIGGVAGHSHKYFQKQSYGYFSRLILVQSMSAVTGACLLVRREIYRAVDGLNERELMVAFNDVDFCLKVREAGYRNLWTPYAELYHHESKSRGGDDTPEKQERFRREMEYMYDRWGPLLASDPYYNPNLSKVREDFSLAMMPNV